MLITGTTWCVAIAPRTEPMHAGKTVSQWLNAGYEDAAHAMHEIGPSALPHIMAKLAREDPQFGSSNRYRRLRARLSPPLRGMLPKPAPANFDETRACGLLLELGPTTIPKLAAELQNRNEAVRITSAHVLRLFGERGKDLRTAVPLLEQALRDPSRKTRRWASLALQNRNCRP